VSNFDDQTEIGADHKRSRFPVAFLNARGQINFFLRGQQLELSDLAKVNFNGGIRLFIRHSNTPAGAETALLVTHR